jgi:hypothetical protein
MNIASIINITLKQRNFGGYISKLIPEFEDINAKLRKYDIVEYDHSTGKYRILKRSR